jgi:hypothetical protein
MSGRLRRLDIEEPAEINTRFTWDQRFRFGQVHPFRFVNEPRTGVKMRVCLDSLTLDESDPTSELTRRFLLDLRPEHYEIFRTPGDALLFSPCRLSSWAAGRMWQAWIWRPLGIKRGAGVHYPGQWDDLAQIWLGDRSAGREIVAVKAAEALDGHLFVTWSPALLQIRDAHRFKIAVVTPLEAMPPFSRRGAEASAITGMVTS